VARDRTRNQRFAVDSPLEERGFEQSVPQHRQIIGILLRRLQLHMIPEGWTGVTSIS
jgi:hypothetical protein